MPRDTPAAPTTHDVPGKMHVLPKPEQPRPRPAPTGPARSTPAEALDVSEMAALHELERDLAAAEVEHMGDVWQRLRAILDGPQQRALAALGSPHNGEADHD